MSSPVTSEPEASDLPLLRFENLSALPGVAHGLATRSGGCSPEPWNSLNLSVSTGDTADNVRENRARLLRALGLQKLSHQNQVHGTTVVRLSGEETDTPPHDAQISDVPGLALLTLGADCPGLLACDPERRMVGVAHAGWRGAVAGIVPQWLDAFARAGSPAKDLHVAIGAGIGPCCYQVGPEVVAQAQAWPGGQRAVEERDGRSYFDIRALLRMQLEDRKVASLEVAPYCTACNPTLFYSHRQSGGRTGRFGLAIGLLA